MAIRRWWNLEENTPDNKFGRLKIFYNEILKKLNLKDKKISRYKIIIYLLSTSSLFCEYITLFKCVEDDSIIHHIKTKTSLFSNQIILEKPPTRN